jgi:MFS family permease
MQVTKNIEREYLLLRIMTFIRYFGDCLFYGYFILFLKSRNLTESTIGMVSALTPIIALISNPLWSHISKNANHNRRIMMIITVLEGIAILIFTQVSVIEMIALLTILVSFVGSPFYSLHDGFIGTFAKTYNKDYTRIRFIGTLAYFAATLVAALLLKVSSNNYSILLYISGACFILISLFFIWIKPIDLKLTKGGEEVKRNYKAILKNKTFALYMIIYFLVITVSFAADNYVGNKQCSHGASNSCKQKSPPIACAGVVFCFDNDGVKQSDGKKRAQPDDDSFKVHGFDFCVEKLCA